MKLLISLNAQNLKNVAGVFKGTSDPFAVVTLAGNKPGDTPRIIGKTEVVKNSLSPNWTTTFDIDYDLGEPSTILVKIFDEVRKGDNIPMGSAVFEVGAVLGAKGNILAKNMKKDKGKIFVKVEPIAATNPTSVPVLKEEMSKVQLDERPATPPKAAVPSPKAVESPTSIAAPSTNAAIPHQKASFADYIAGGCPTAEPKSKKKVRGLLCVLIFGLLAIIDIQFIEVPGQVKANVSQNGIMSNPSIHVSEEQVKFALEDDEDEVLIADPEGKVFDFSGEKIMAGPEEDEDGIGIGIGVGKAEGNNSDFSKKELKGVGPEHELEGKECDFSKVEIVHMPKVDEDKAVVAEPYEEFGFSDEKVVAEPELKKCDFSNEEIVVGAVEKEDEDEVVLTRQDGEIRFSDDEIVVGTVEKEDEGEVVVAEPNEK